ncbi:MAG: MarR family transcriptional regulator [Candidatus Bathyarchaeia archaeon]
MDLQKQENRIRSISQTVERLSLGDKHSRRIEEIRDELEHIKDGLREASIVKVEVSAKIEELGKKVESLMSQQEESMKKMMELEASIPKGPVMTDRIQGVIPIRKERALASLTGTELRVLEILSAEGEKTASQIRDKIKLTREHTARLMKSLYTRGYVERRTDRLPYVYRIKSEMLKILKKKGARPEPT